MKYSLQYTKVFKKKYNKLPELIKIKTKKTLHILSENPSYPSLRTKTNYSWSNYLKVKVYECSVNMEYRIIFTYEEGSIILLQAIGKHEIVDKK
jgi:mRNA-degrading endonuclease RelE of RelBE toxin-antitoxin system